MRGFPKAACKATLSPQPEAGAETPGLLLAAAATRCPPPRCCDGPVVPAMTDPQPWDALPGCPASVAHGHHSITGRARGRPSSADVAQGRDVVWGCSGSTSTGQGHPISICLAWGHPVCTHRPGTPPRPPPPRWARCGMPAAPLSPAPPSASHPPPDRRTFTASSQIIFSQLKAVSKLHFTLENYL